MMRLSKKSILIMVYISTALGTQEKKPLYNQQFSQQFLDTMHNSQSSKPEKTTFSMLDTLYLHKQNEQSNQTTVSKTDYTPLYYAIAVGACIIWLVYKFHQGLSCIVGEKISDFVFNKLFTGIYTSCYWLIKQTITDIYGILKKILEYVVTRGFS